MRRRFFVEKFEGNSAALRGDAARHLRTVLRAEPGQRYELSDGSRVWLGEITGAESDSVKFSLVEQIAARELTPHIHLLLAIVKFDRFEWAIEKGTELGVARVTPIAVARSEKGLLAAAPKRAARWQKIMFESAQQSRRLAPPSLGELSAASEAFARAGKESAICVLLSEDPDAASLREVLNDAGKRAQDLLGNDRGARSIDRVVLGVGPEGGWTQDELEAARAAHFVAASLGSRILRTETAVAAGIACVNYAFGE